VRIRREDVGAVPAREREECAHERRYREQQVGERLAQPERRYSRHTLLAVWRGVICGAAAAAYMFCARMPGQWYRGTGHREGGMRVPRHASAYRTGRQRGQGEGSRRAVQGGGGAVVGGRWEAGRCGRGREVSLFFFFLPGR